jgi:hypothetical protein
MALTGAEKKALKKAHLYVFWQQHQQLMKSHKA